MRLRPLICALALSVAALAANALEVKKPYLQLGPMLGHVGATEARVWVKASEKAKVEIRFWRADAANRDVTVKAPEPSSATDFMTHVTIPNLAPETQYSYVVLLNGKPAMFPPYPSFTTAPEKGKKGVTRICFVSCIGRNSHEPAAAWADMAARAKFDLLLMLGDNHYADSTSPEKQRPAYYAHRAVSGFKEVTSRVATYAIWDDHDFGPNDSDGTAAGKEISLETFKQFWPNPAYGETDNPGCYFRLTRGDVDFFMLDGRYHRTPNKAPEDGKKTMLGEKQLEWLKRELLLSTATVKFLAHGSEWQSHGTKDSWTSFARERDELFNFIEEKKISGVMLLSGDRHFTGCYQVKGRFIEATSGPLGSKNYPTKNLPEMFLNYGEGKMYSIYEVDTTGAEPSATLEIYRAGDGLLEKRKFSWEQICGFEKIPPLPPSPPTPKK
ncbi:MAG TPA: alkaline phosphatase D family protein [Planctomycetota bacterium]|nr:alkaline phosphatase D family protein [Planctomycetota bacterium]